MSDKVSDMQMKMNHMAEEVREANLSLKLHKELYKEKEIEFARWVGHRW